MISTNPVDGTVVARYDRTTPADVAKHIATADQLQREWMRTDLGTRRAHMLRLADVLESRADELATLMALEMGKPVSEGRGEAKKCAWVCRYYADEAETILADHHVDTGRAHSYVAYRPLGVILAVMPWNFPCGRSFGLRPRPSWPATEESSNMPPM